MSAAFPLPPDLPKPVNDGACDHLPGTRVPPITLPSTSGRMVNLGALTAPRTVIYCYPRTGVPGEPLPEGWDMIPGARGCTPQACDFRDHHRELADLGADVFGLSTQTTEYQREMAERLHLPFDVNPLNWWSGRDRRSVPKTGGSTWIFTLSTALCGNAPWFGALLGNPPDGYPARRASLIFRDVIEWRQEVKQWSMCQSQQLKQW